MAYDGRHGRDRLPSVFCRPNFPRLLYCIVLVWMALWILGVEQVFRNAARGGWKFAVASQIGYTNYDLSPTDAFQRGLAPGELLSWDFYWSLLTSEVPRNATYEAAGVRHVSSGAVCLSCNVEPYAFLATKPSWIALSNAQGWFASRFNSQRSPPENHTGTGCYGCLHELIRVKGSPLLQDNKVFSLREGKTAAGVFFASGPNVPGGKAVVKVRCLYKEGFLRQERCSKSFIRSIAHERAVRKIADECGLGDVLPRAWLSPVDGLNGTERLNTMGYWSEVADGLSFGTIWAQATRKMAVELVSGVNSTQVVMAALLDAITGQVDRNPHNAFVSPSGKLTLIDNERVFRLNCWGIYFGFRCEDRVRSLFIPSPPHGLTPDMLKWNSTKFEGDSVIMWGRHVRNTGLGLDYRCHTPHGNIRFDFPPQVKACLLKFSKMNTARVVREVFLGNMGFPTAKELVRRSKDLLGLGFEGAIEKWNADSGRPDIQFRKPCCKMEAANGTVKYTCESVDS